MLCVTMINIKIETVEKSHKICSKLTIKTPERCQRLRFGVFIVDLEHISHHFSSVYC